MLVDLLVQLRERGVRLWLEDDRLRFGAPRGALTEELRKALADGKDEIIQLLKGARTDGKIPRAPRAGSAPASSGQRRLWFVDRLDPGGTAYNVTGATRLEGLLDLAALERALAEVVRRHESLRTSFSVEADEPVQVVAEQAASPIFAEDASAWTDEELTERIEAWGTQPFDLAGGPLFRARLLRLGAETHVLGVTMHHIVSDGWSIGVLLRELAALYSAYARGEASPLPELPIQYGDYATWQRARLAGGELAGEIAYWKRKLEGIGALELAVDRPRPAVMTQAGTTHRFRLDDAVAAAVRDLNRREGTSLFMLVLAAWEAFLSRYAGQSDFGIATPIANRTRHETAGLIGFFVNTLVLRSDVTPGMTFRRLLARVKETALEAFAHQDAPFEEVARAVKPERDPSRLPLAQVMLVVQSAGEAHTGRISLANGLALTPVELPVRSSKCELTLTVNDADSGLLASLEYNTDLFDAETVSRMAEHFSTMLGEALRAPDAQLSDLAIMGEAERARVVVEWNQTSAPGGEGATLLRLFAEQAKTAPFRTAVEFGAESLSYAELDRASTQVANRLREWGVGPETAVGICVDPTLLLPVGLLGILKAGGAYVPFDPAYPAERLSAMAEQARSSVLVTDRASAARAGGTFRHELFLDEGSWRSAGGDPPDARVTSENLAYVIFTSGSTGRPKGVGVSHGAIANRMLWARAAFGLGAGDRVLHHASLSFDASVAEIFGALCSGATLVVSKAGDSREPRRLLELVREKAVTVLELSPALLQALVEDGGLKEIPSLRYVGSGGEALASATIERFASQTKARLVNLYGPTETAVDATFWPCASDGGGHVAPLGRPIANARAYVLDPALNPVPIGVPGELYVAGAGLARGYLGEAGLTAERFLPDPFPGRAGARMYRTGDRVRRLLGGDLEFLGRLDHQVKLRGFRIELGEIESLLVAHAAVREASASVVEAGRAPMLVAFVAGETGAEPRPDLRGWLAERVPHYMVPSRIVWLDSLPRTPNGKIDHKGLATLDVHESVEHVPARTSTEASLVGIWEEVLGATGLGVSENFFDVGGHSLLATRVISRVRSVMGVEVPLRVLFEHPTIAELGAYLAGASTGSVAGPVRVARTGPLDASYAQERMWFLDEFEPGGYVLAGAVRARGPLDTSALARAVGELVRRHESLRTTFDRGEGGVVQRVADPTPCLLPVTEIAASELEPRLRAEATTGFDLRRGPPFRATLFRVAPEHHVLVLAMHHIVSDGWSMGILVRETAALYAAYSRGQESPLPEPPLQYADYAVWQRDWLSGGELSRQLEYWKSKLSDVEVLNLPVDRPRPLVRTMRGASHRFRLDGELARAARELCRREGASLFMLLLAAWQALLGRYSGQDRFGVGTPIANRSRRETEGVIGFFVNTLVIRADVPVGTTFRELLGRVRETALQAYAHQDAPFEKVVEALGLPRDPSTTPLFQTMLVVQNAEEASSGHAGAGIALSPVELPTTTALFDLTLTVVDAGEWFEASLAYSTDVFDAATAAGMADHFGVLLGAALRAPDSDVSRLALMGEAERRRALVEWNATGEAADARGSFVHEWMDEQGAREPLAIAVIHENDQVSYEDLLGRANQLAHKLRSLGVGPEQFVGLCVDRSPSMVAGVLGIMKAGGAYLPLDPSYPIDRLEYMIGDARVAVAVADAASSAWLSSAGVRCVRMDDGSLDAFPRTPPPRAATPSNAAYAIYTSGSTGRPKAVVVEHRHLAASTSARLAAYPERLERYALVSSIAFDSSVAGLFWALGSGAALVLPRAGEQADVGALKRLVRERAVSHVLMTPSQYRLFLEEPGACPGLRVAIVAGEACPGDVAALHSAALPDCALYNEYGPTEATVWCTRHRCASFEARATVPIGRPIANTQAYVLDERIEPVATGLLGELHVGGAGVARGYLRRPELTAERFIANPFGAGRLYKTGDLVRHLADGSLEFVGRTDHQVKIRGFRIEPGEIEAAVCKHQGVRACTVLVREDSPGEKRLVAYVAGDSEPASLREHAAKVLPPHMVPSAIVVLDALPQTPNGKVDRKALLALEVKTSARHVEPRTELEAALARIWEETLGVERVGVEDNFFELGGHSLLATRVMSRIRTRLGVHLPLRAIFEAPTIAGLATRIGPQREDSAPPLVALPRTRPLPVSYAQERLLFVEQLEPSAAYTIPVPMSLVGPLDVAALERAVSAIVARHEALRTTFAEDEDGVPYQVIAPAQTIKLPVTTLPTATGNELQRQMDEEVGRLFDLSDGPLFRARLWRVNEGEHVLLLTMHHIISDGWSVSILVRELSSLYEAFSAGRPLGLPELPVQYADYAMWQRKWLEGGEMEKQLSYWRKHLEGAPVRLKLPTDSSPGEGDHSPGATHTFAIPRELAERAHAYSRQEGITLFMTLLAAYTALLGRHTDQRDIVVGAPIANRTRSQVEGVVGFFANTLPLRTSLAGSPSFSDLVRRVKEATLGADANQDVPFDRIVDALRPRGSREQSPLFRVMFILQNEPQPAMGSNALKVSALAAATTTAKFDLSLGVFEAEGALTACFEYRTDLFRETTIARLATELVALLREALARPTQPLHAEKTDREEWMHA